MTSYSSPGGMKSTHDGQLVAIDFTREFICWIETSLAAIIFSRLSTHYCRMGNINFWC